MVDDILDIKYNFTIDSNKNIKNLTKKQLDTIDKITSEHQIELSTYLKKKNSIEKNLSNNSANSIKSKKSKNSENSVSKKNGSKSYIDLTERAAKRRKKVPVQGGMPRNPPRNPSRNPPQREEVNVNLPEPTLDEMMTFDATNNQTNRKILQDAYATTYNYYNNPPPEAMPIGNELNFTGDPISSASARNGVCINTTLGSDNDKINAVKCAQWFDTIWRSVVRSEHANLFAGDFGDIQDRWIIQNIDLNPPPRGGEGNLLDMVENIINRIPEHKRTELPIATPASRHVNINYACRPYVDSDNNVFNEHRTYRLLFLVTKDIHFTFFCHRFADGNIEFCSPHYTYLPQDENGNAILDHNGQPKKYRLYVDANEFLSQFNRNEVKNPIISLSILVHYISKTAYLLLFTDYAPGNYNINPDYKIICEAQVRYRPDRRDFIELGHYTDALNYIIYSHLKKRFYGQNLQLFRIYQREIGFYLDEYYHYLPELLTGTTQSWITASDIVRERERRTGPPPHSSSPVTLQNRQSHRAIVPNESLNNRNGIRFFSRDNIQTEVFPPLNTNAYRYYSVSPRVVPVPPPRYHNRYIDNLSERDTNRAAQGGPLSSGMDASRSTSDRDTGMAARGPPPSTAVQGRGDRDWYCPRCGSMVFGSRSYCYKCYEPKPQNADTVASRVKEQPRAAAKGAPRGRGPNEGDRGNGQGKGTSGAKRRGGAPSGISTNKTLIKYLNKEKELKIDIKLLKKDKNKNKKKIIKKTDLLKKLKLKIIDKKEKLKKQKQKEKEKEKLKKQKEKEKLKKTKRKT